MRRFLRVPFSIHADDPCWVPPLFAERRHSLSPRTNPFLRDVEVRFWIARRAGEDVGRISAQINRRVLDLHKNSTGHFGLIAATDDPSVFGALAGAAEDWLRGRGLRRVEGPFNLTINQEMGLLVDGFDTPPMALMAHDRPHASARLEELGYAKVKDVIAYEYDIMRQDPPQLRAVLGRRTPAHIRLRPLDKSRYYEEIRTVTAIFNEAWSGNWGFTPLTDAETHFLATSLKPLVHERGVWFGEIEGEAAGFVIGLPNLNEAIADLNGRLFPFGWAKLLWRLKVRGITTGRVPLMGVRRKYANSTVGWLLPFLLIDALRRNARAFGMRRVELSWILEDNRPMRRIIEAIGGVPYKTYRIYGKEL